MRLSHSITPPTPVARDTGRIGPDATQTTITKPVYRWPAG